jgi:hypothetical protein
VGGAQFLKKEEMVVVEEKEGAWETEEKEAWVVVVVALKLEKD